MTDKNTSEYTIKSASAIIDRFGGIRPMATKIKAAVTTVQGWKKRDAIPPHRIDHILSCATDHDIDLSDLVIAPAPAQADTPQEGTAPETPAETAAPKANESIYAEAKAQREAAATKPRPAQAPKPKTNYEEEAKKSVLASTLHDDIIYSITQAERRAVKKSTWTTISLIGVSALALALIFGLQSGGSMDKKRLAELKAMHEEMQTLKEELKEAKEAPPVILMNQENMGAIKDTLRHAQNQTSHVINEAKAISNSLVNGDKDTIVNGIKSLEGYLDNLGKFPDIANITQRFTAFASTAGGQDLLEKSSDALNDALSGLKNPTDADIEYAIEQARSQSVALGQSLEDVPSNDLKAAAMLLTMTQLRSALNRDGEPFADDLALLQSLTKDSSPELQASIQKLAPHADKGVLTSAGLSSELRSLTGEIVVASLKGEKLSIQERAQARMESVLLINQENGDLKPQTTAQETLSNAEKMLQDGNIEGAIAHMQSLDGSAAKIAAPWIDQAQTSLLARDLKATLSGVLDTKAAGLKSYGTIQKHNNGNLRPIFLRP